jgi:hypothetical protein
METEKKLDGAESDFWAGFQQIYRLIRTNSVKINGFAKFGPESVYLQKKSGNFQRFFKPWFKYKAEFCHSRKI